MSFSINKQWINESDLRSPNYIDGVQKFISFVEENGGKKGVYLCPCTRCKNMKTIKLDDIHFHLLRWGFIQSYTVWYFHGEKRAEMEKQQPVSHATTTDESEHIRMEDLINDVDRFHHFQPTNPLPDHANVGEQSEQMRVGSLEGTMRNLSGRLEVLINMVGNIEQRIRAPVNSSDGGRTTHFNASEFVASQFQNSTNVANNQKCEILNSDLDIVAIGIVCRDSTLSIMHGKSVPPTHEKVMLDNILLPNERTSKINHQFAETFADVLVGGFVCHPKALIRYL